MVGFSEQIELVLKLLILMLVGFFIRKLNIIDKDGRKTLANIVLLVTLPCSILNSFFQSTLEGSNYLWLIFFISLGIHISLLILSKFLFKHCEPDHIDSLQYGIVVPNSGILGTPIAAGLFGTMGVVLSSIYLIPMRIMMWTFGLAIFTKKLEGKSAIKAFSHPCVVSVFIGLFVLLSGITIPTLINDTITSIGNCNTAISLILVGIIIGDMDYKLIFHRESIYFTLIRLIGIPLLVLFICNIILGGIDINNIFFGSNIDDELLIIRNVCVVLSAMPAGSTTPIMAVKYGGNESFASALVSITTTLSLVAIPAWCYFLS